MRLKSFTSGLRAVRFTSGLRAVLFVLTAVRFMLTTATFTVAQQEPPVAPDPIEQLRLTPDQRQAIRQIVAETRDERQITNRRLREANVALDQALDAEPTDENVIEQRINDLANAQAAQLRMRIHTEMRIRRILRPEQLATLRRLRLQLRDVMSPQRLNNTRRPANQGFGSRP
jgi:Spy/CpxP family protein refolding chaperone